MQYFRKLLIFSFFIYVPCASSAWGLLGHRIVGQIADSYLTKQARKQIREILGTESIAMASNWLDFIKSDPAFKYLTPWHYADLRAGMTYDAFSQFFSADTAVDAYTKITFLADQLKYHRTDLAQQTKVMYLRLLIHIVGDVHQPFHVGRAEDKGANTIKVKWFSDSVNLHQVWDGKLIDFQQLSYTEYADAINHTTKEQREAWQKQPLLAWMWDSYSLAEKIYADTRPGDKLGFDYNFKYLAPLNDRLLQGGVHLAGLLNDIFR